MHNENEQKTRAKPKEKRPELRGMRERVDGISVTRTALLREGSAFSRLLMPNNQDCPEYILGQIARELGYRDGDKVSYTLIVHNTPGKD